MIKSDWDNCIRDRLTWEGVFFEDAVFVIDGKQLMNVPPSTHPVAPIHIRSGVVVDTYSGRTRRSLAEHVRLWQEKQKTRRLSVIVPEETKDTDIQHALDTVQGRLGGSESDWRVHSLEAKLAQSNKRLHGAIRAMERGKYRKRSKKAVATRLENQINEGANVDLDGIANSLEEAGEWHFANLVRQCIPSDEALGE